VAEGDRRRSVKKGKSAYTPGSVDGGETSLLTGLICTIEDSCYNIQRPRHGCSTPFAMQEGSTSGSGDAVVVTMAEGALAESAAHGWSSERKAYMAESAAKGLAAILESS